MSINTERKNLKLNKCCVSDKVCSWIEQDIIVPDTKPDAMKIVNVTVTPYVTHTEVQDSKLKVTGNINYFVIYKVADERFSTRGLFVNYPYTQVLPVKGLNNNLDITVTPVTKNIIYSLPNERKILVKSEVMFKIKAMETMDIHLVQSFDSDINIECKMCQQEFNNIKCHKKELITSHEDVLLPKEVEDFFELLNVSYEIKNTEYKDSYNKIMLKGDIEAKLIYLTENREESVRKTIITIPFSSMVEVDNINENSKFDISYRMQEFNLKPGEDMSASRAIAAEYQIEAEVTMFEEEDVAYVEDFYSQTRDITYQENKVKVVRKSKMSTKRMDIKEAISNILPDNSKILDYYLDTGYITPNIASPTRILEGSVKVNLLYQNTENLELENKIVEILINQNLELDDVREENNLMVEVKQENVTVVQSANDIEVRLTLTIEQEIEELSEIRIVDDISDNVLDSSNLDSINIYVVKNHDTLWNIAKKYKTSVEKIVRINELDENAVLAIGQKILVIR